MIILPQLVLESRLSGSTSIICGRPDREVATFGYPSHRSMAEGEAGPQPINATNNITQSNEQTIVLLHPEIVAFGP